MSLFFGRITWHTVPVSATNNVFESGPRIILLLQGAFINDYLNDPALFLYVKKHELGSCETG